MVQRRITVQKINFIGEAVVAHIFGLHTLYDYDYFEK